VIDKNILSAIGTSYFLLQQKGLNKGTIQEILGILGEATEVDRIYIFHNSYNTEGEFCMNYKFEWVADGVSPQLDFSVLQNLPWSVFPEIEEELKQNKTINEFVKNTSNQFFYKTMVEQGIISYCFVPIISNNLFWGYIGFDNCSKNKLFTEPQKAALHAFASTLGTAILAKRRRKSLIRSRKKYYNLINSLEDVVFNMCPKGKITFVNKAWESFTGFTGKFSVHKPFVDFLSPRSKVDLDDILQRFKADPTTRIDQELQLINASGGFSWVFGNFSKELNESPLKRPGITGVLKKIDEEKVAYKMREGSDQFKPSLDAEKDIFYAYLVDTEEGVFVSDNFYLWGLEKEDFFNISSFLKKVHSKDLPLLQNALENLSEKRILDLNYRIINKQKEVVWVQDRAWIEKDQKGKDFKIYGRLSDVTALKEKEIKLKASEERFRSITENIPLPLFICENGHSKISYANQLFLNLFKFSSFDEISPIEMNGMIRNKEGKGISFLIDENPKIEGLEVLVSDGINKLDQKIFSLSSHVVPFDSGLMTLVVLFDITYRKENEARIQELNVLLQAINETQLSYFEQDDLDVPLQTLLETILKITGSKMGFLGEVLYDKNSQPYFKTHSFSYKKEVSHSKDRFKKKYGTEVEIRDIDTLFGETLKTGKVVICNDVISEKRNVGIPIDHPVITRYIGIPVYKGQDFLGMMSFGNKEKPYSLADVEFLMPIISGYANFIQNIRINRERKKSDSMYRLLSENTGDIISLHNTDNTFRYVSPSVEKVLGFQPKELLGKKPMEVFKIPELPFPIPGGTDTSIILHKTKRHEKSVYLEVIRKVLNDENGYPEAFIATSRDVTDRENVLEDLKKSLVKEKELNQLKSRFINMTSHEFRTPLATIQSSTELIEIIVQKLNNEDISARLNVHTKRINAQVKRLTEVISDILILEKNNEGRMNFHKEPIIIKSFVKNLITDNFETKENHPLLKLKLPEEEKVVYSDPVWLTHIIKNIVENAIKYSGESKVLPELRLSFFKAYIQFQIKDYGIGIPEEDRKNIFDSFFRAKNVSNIKGTGLGLSIVNEFIHLLGGSIVFKSKEGGGTVFTIKLPYESNNASLA
jgi:PAS domain S-box-containing protein